MKSENKRRNREKRRAARLESGPGTATVGEVVRFYGKYLRGHRGRLGLAGGCLLVAVVTNLARPWPLKIVIDYVLLPENRNSRLDFLLEYDRATVLAAACLTVVLVAVLYGYFEYLHKILAAGVGQKLVFKIRGQLFTHVQRLSLGFHTRARSGDLLSRLIRDVTNLRNFLTTPALQLVSESVFAAGLLAVMFFLDWRMTSLVLLLVPLLFILIVYFSGRIRRITRRQRRRQGEVASLFHETLAAIQEVKLFGGDQEESGRFEKQNRADYRSEMQALRTKSRLLRLVGAFTAVGMGFVLWWGAREVLSGQLSPGDLLVFVAYLKSFYKPIRRVAAVSAQASKALVSAERVMEILRTEPEILDSTDAVTAPRFQGAVEFRNVSFGYEPSRTVLHDISFRTEPGQTVAIIGPSGAGKSSLVSLIPRLYEPNEGAVLIDGRDIREYAVASLREQIAVVPQEPVLFSGRIRENISYGEPAADLAAIESAAALAQAAEFIEKLPQGYDTVVGERGATLSGGQRQRIAIARALMRNKQIVIFDEPMRGIDLVAESLILKALDNLLRDKTAFVIAHRLSTLLQADQVIVMQAGKIVEMGRPQQLFQAKGQFRQLAEMQFSPKELHESLHPAERASLQ